MSTAVAQGWRGSIIGVKEESVYGTAVTPTSFLCMNSDGLGVEEEKVKSDCINARYREGDEVYQGNVNAGGDFGVDARYEGLDKYLLNLLGASAITETASFAVTASNKYFDFSEDGGGALVGTVAESTYVMGDTSADAGSLCEAIKTALEATGSGTYTITFSNVTKKITIAVAGAISATAFLWKTGAHGSDNLDDHIGTLIGFDDTADGSSVASVVADNVVVTVFSNAFTISDTLPASLTLEKQTDATLATGQIFTYDGAHVNSMDFNMETNSILKVNMNILAKDETVGDAVTAPVQLSTPHILFSQPVVLLNSVDITAKIPTLNFTVNKVLAEDRYRLGDRTRKEPTPGGKIEVTGSMTVEYDASTLYNLFRNNTSVPLVITFTGTDIKTGFAYSYVITMPAVKLIGGTPKIADPSIILQEIPFEAYATDSTTREVSMTMVNTLATI